MVDKQTLVREIDAARAVRMYAENTAQRMRRVAMEIEEEAQEKCRECQQALHVFLAKEKDNG